MNDRDKAGKVISLEACARSEVLLMEGAFLTQGAGTELEEDQEMPRKLDLTVSPV